MVIMVGRRKYRPPPDRSATRGFGSRHAAPYPVCEHFALAATQ